MAGEDAFRGGNAFLARQIQNRVAGHSFQNPSIDVGGEQLATLDEEDVVRGALGDFAVLIEHERFGDTRADRLDFGENVIEVVERFDSRIERVGMIANGRSGDDFHAAFVHFAGVKRNGIDNDDHIRFGATAGIETQIAFAATHDQTDVPVLELVGVHGFFYRELHLGQRKRYRQTDVIGAFVKPFEVFAEFEDFAAVNPQAFENAIPVKEPMVVNMDGGLFVGDHFPIEINNPRHGKPVKTERKIGFFPVWRN